MGSRRLTALSAAAFAASASMACAGPCASQIDAMQARIDARLAAKGTVGRGSAESSGALLHHQPTPESIARAEERLGELSPEKVASVTQAMERARAGDRAGDAHACEQALEAVQRAMGR